MRKITSLIRAGAASLALFALAAPASAALTAADVIGDYTFTAGLTVENPSYSGVLLNDYTFSITTNANGASIKFNNFVVEGFDSSMMLFGNGQNLELGPNTYVQGLYFADKDGNYPDWASYQDEEGNNHWVSTNEFYLTVSFNDDGSVTVPDFTVVTLNEPTAENPTATTNIIARYSNVQVNKVAEEGGGDGDDDITSNVPGNYTVTATKYVKTTDENEITSETSESVTFTMTIDEDGYLSQFAGYNGITEYADYGNQAGKLSENDWSLNQSGYKLYIDFEDYTPTAPMPAVVLGGDVAGRYTAPNLKLSLGSDGTWTLSNFTIWKVAAPWTGTPETSLGEYQVVKVLKEGQEDPMARFAGEQSITGWWKADFTGVTGDELPNVEAAVNFNVSINSVGQLTSIGGYELDSDMIDYGYYKGSLADDTWTLELDRLNSVLNVNETTGAPSLILGGPKSAYSALSYLSGEFPYDSNLTLTYADNAYTLSDFTIWNVRVESSEGETDEEGNTSSDSTTYYDLLYQYSSSEIEGNQPQPVEYPSLEQLAGEYEFNADITIVDSNFSDYFANKTFSMEADGNKLKVTGLLFDGYVHYSDYDKETGEINMGYNFYYDFDTEDDLMFSNTEGIDPMYGWDYEMIWKVDTEGNITVPDFTVVNENWNTGTGITIVARFSNVTVKRTGEVVEEDDVNFTGTYKVTGTYVSYADDDDASPLADGADSFTLVIGENDELVQFAGYSYSDLQPIQESNSLYLHTFSEKNAWALTSYFAYLEKSGINNATRNVIVSGESTDSYQQSAEITLTYNDGEYTLSPFTLWVETNAASDAENQSKNYTLLGAWNNLSVVKTSDAVETGVKNILDSDDAPAVYYNLQGVKVANPDKGIYIVVKGNKSSKVIL